MTREEYNRMRKLREERARRRRRKYAIRRLAVLTGGIVIILAVVLIGAKLTHLLSGNGAGAPDGSDIAVLTNNPEPSAAPDFYNPETENDLIKIADAISELHSEDKICYLTFDDGPSSSVTPQILDTLKEYDVKATFFLQGQQIEKNRDTALREFEEGHLLANHSMYHNYSKLYASVNSFIDEIDMCYELICDITGQENKPFKLVRFPGGCFDTPADSYSPIKLECKEEIAKLGYFEVNWNALTGDAEGSAKTPEQLLAYLKKYLSDKQTQVIILMHDTDAKPSTAQALSSIIEYMRDRGFEFRRLDEMPYYEDVQEYLENGAASDTDYDSKSTAKPDSAG